MDLLYDKIRLITCILQCTDMFFLILIKKFELLFISLSSKSKINMLFIKKIQLDQMKRLLHEDSFVTMKESGK